MQLFIYFFFTYTLRHFMHPWGYAYPSFGVEALKNYLFNHHFVKHISVLYFVYCIKDITEWAQEHSEKLSVKLICKFSFFHIRFTQCPKCYWCCM